MLKSKRIKSRSIVQIFFFVLIGAIAINKTLAEAGGGISFLSEASLHALCPFGGVVTLYNLATLGTFIQKIHMSSVVLMGIIFILAVFFGPVFCGWICPLGSFQEWIGKIGKRIFKNRYNNFVPKGIDRYMRYFRYLLLIAVVIVTSKSGYLMFTDIDPYYALFNFWSNEVAPKALIVLGVTIILSLFVERPWCKYACPYGALLGLTNKFRIFKIRRTQSSCINCKACDKACPMNITISGEDAITDHQCISCMECTSESSCPMPNTVNLAKINQPTVKIQSKEEQQ
ncbi:4Fe-4S binding protein [Clostridium sp.]|uniref:4Fe-4S binding protein n=1 Tax=Clostridium sp. TaxID=1506 RepID=UPI001A648525|nr:4Fe-4S binding protein [Clostridium sp.]MBK5243378.1 4Fe-4S binding protein [Clostridium sp.]